MYKIYVKNNETNCEWWEYGFGGYMMKRVQFLLSEQQNYTYEPQYTIIWCFKLDFTFDIFKKCLTRKTQLVKQAQK